MHTVDFGIAACGFASWRKRLLTGVSCATLAAGITCSTSAAQTWTGGGANGSWSNAANWTPGAPVSSNTTDLVFATDGLGFDPTNVTAGFQLRNIAIGGSFTGTITGQSLVQIGSEPHITMNASADVEITNDIDFTDQHVTPFQGLYFNGSGEGTLTLSGVLSSPGDASISKLRTSQRTTIELAGANTYLGRTEVGELGGAADPSTLIASHDFALGDSGGGTIVDSGATLALRGGINLREQSITLMGQGVGDNGALRNLGGNNTVLGDITLVADSWIRSDADLLTLEGDLLSATFDANFSGSGDITVNGDIATGSGWVSVSGGGTTTLSGANTYSGGTNLIGGILSVSADENLGAASGVLRFSGGTLKTTADIFGFWNSSRAVTIDAGGATFDLDAGLGLSGLISGNGGLTTTGATLTLTADNTYTGGTTISAGALKLGNGGTSGSIVGDVVNDGTLVFERSDDVAFDGTISGSGSVLQVGSGTVMLTADNTYTGGTSISSAGALQLGDGGTTGSVQGDILNNGILVFNRADTLTIGGTISNTGAVNQIGSGVTMLAGASTYSGATTISAGTLRAGAYGAFSPSSAFSVLDGGTLDLAGFSHTLDSLANAGLVLLTGAPGIASATAGAPAIAPTAAGVGTTLTVAGDYAGNGGTIAFNTVLDGDGSATDRLVVNGDTSGSTDVQVTNVGGEGVKTVEGIKIIEVSGASDGTFTLLGDYEFEGEPALVAGAYAYRLYQGGASTPDDGDWYLRSAFNTGDPLFQASMPLYEALGGTVQAFNQLGTTEQRLGNRSWVEGGGTVADDDIGAGYGLWAHIEAARAHLELDTSATGTSYEPSLWKLQAGADTLLAERASGVLLGGVSVHYGTIDADITSAHGTGSIETTGIGVGGTLTWYADNGAYVDGQVQLTWYDNDLRSATAGRDIANGLDSMGYAVGIEMGRQIALGGNWSLTPQMQLAYSLVDVDDFTGVLGETVSLEKSESLVGRLGVALTRDSEWRDVFGRTTRANLYGIASLYHEFEGGSKVTVEESSFTSESERLSAGIGVGGSLNWAEDRYSLYGDATAKTGLDNFGDSYSVSGTLGFRMRW